jgi:hypothetical protein
MSNGLRDLLELAAEDVPEVDLADIAWEQARREQRRVRRRVLLGAGGVAAAGALVTALARREDGTAPAVRPSPSASGDPRLDEVVVSGIRVSMAPAPRSEPALLLYPDARALALPASLGTGEARPRPVLSPDGIAGSQASVRAVFLVRAGDGYQPVVYLPAEDPQHLVVPGMAIEEVRDATGATGPVLGPRTVSDDRHRVVVAQRHKILVLDVRDASVLELPVPDDGLLHAGFAKDDRTVIARSGENEWLVDTQTHRVQRSPVPARPDWADLAQGSSGEVELRAFAGSGTITESRSLAGATASTYGESSANTEGWVASGVWLEGDLRDGVARSQGILAVQSDLQPTPRVLAAPDVEGVPKETYRPLGWGPRDTLLLESRSFADARSEAVVRVLAWDVIGARLWRVADVEAAAGDTEGGFTGVYAI